MRKLGIAVIGVGVMGRHHAENLVHRVPEAKLVAVADADLSRAREVAAKLGIEHFYGTLEEAVARPEVEAVVIATPAKFHPEAICVAAVAGKAILCEKPLALTLGEADRALAAVEKAGVALQIGFMRRYDPSYADAKKRIEAGEIGDPLIFKAIGRDPEPPPLSYRQAGQSGGLFLDSSIHEFDLARWLMQDEVVSVQATGAVVACPELAAEGDIDVGLVNVRFARGGIGNVESFRQACYGYDIRTEIVGSKGTLQIGFLGGTPQRVLTSSSVPQDMHRHFLTRFADAYYREVRDFVQRVLKGQPPRVSGLDGRHALAIVLAAERSHLESRVVSLDEMPGLQANTKAMHFPTS
ncbi:MAG: Gfo/Idh/MocA family oxidoreductase [Terriglobia bacterium]